MSKPYLDRLRQYLSAFIKDRESVSISAIGHEAIEKWFNDRQEPASARHSNTGLISALFSFAKRRGWVQENPCFRLEPVKLIPKTPRILTIKECKKVLEVCPDEFKPAIVLRLFCGIRPEETLKLRWDAVDLDRRLVRIDASISKIGRLRFCPVPENAVAALARFKGKIAWSHRDLNRKFDFQSVQRFHKENGRSWIKTMKHYGISSRGTLHYLLGIKENSHTAEADKVSPCLATLRRRQRDIRVAMGWDKWPQDVLRHSAISYWCAHLGDVGRVATQMGNSVSIIHRHYFQLVGPEVAKEFFSLEIN